LERLWACLKHGGILGIMTKLAPDQDAFSSWHYKNDPTHVCFFSQFTFKWLADQWGAELTFADKDVVIFSKKSLSSEGETLPSRFSLPSIPSRQRRGDSRC